jgi:hypothetical protein
MTSRKPSRCVSNLEIKEFHITVGHVSSSNSGESNLARKLSRVVVHKSHIKMRKLS